MNKYDALFQPLKVGPALLKNRIAMAPMGVEYMTEADGTLNRRVVEYYLERARNGVGMLICSVFKVENEIEKLEQSTPMIREESMNYLCELCDAAHSYNTKIFIQLTAGFGRVTFPTVLRGPCVSPSDNTNYWDPAIKCKPLSIDEIQSIVKAMGDTAQLLELAGVDGIELHGHEGYLFDEFTTPLWNRREDKYGGSFENRMRFPVECLEEIRSRVGNSMAVVYRFGLKHYLKSTQQGALPGEKFQEVGRDVEEGIRMAKCFEEAGFDGLHVDAGCYESHYWPHPPIYQKHGCMVDMGSLAKEQVSIPVIGVGRLDNPDIAELAVSSGKLDIAAIGRGLLADPAWVDKLQYGDKEDIRPCVGCYDGCFEAYSQYRNISCAVNPSSGREGAYRLTPAIIKKKVIVVGGGIAGMEAARVASLRGHHVLLYEKGDKLGGLVHQAAVPDFKKDLRTLLGWYERQIEQSTVEVNLSSEFDSDKCLELAPDVVICATGASPIIPAISGIDQENVISAVELLKNKPETGKQVIVVGGGLAGCEVAIWLAEQGKKVTVLEMLPELMSGAARVPVQVKMMTLDLMKFHGVNSLTGCKLLEIDEKLVKISSGEGGVSNLEFDTIVLAVGMKPENQLAADLQSSGCRIIEIGDCRKPKNVMQAVWDGYEVTRTL